jgi:hypothetical protein
MPLKKEVEDWIKSLPLKKEFKEAFEKELENDELQTKVRESVMFRPDYSRSMDQLKADREKLEGEVAQAKANADGLFNANMKWREDNAKVYQDTLAVAQERERQLLEYNQRLKYLVDTGQLDPRLLEGTANPPPSNHGTPPANPQQYLTPQQMQQALLEKEKQFAYAVANIEDMADQHKTLFGQSLNRKELISDMLKSGKSLEDVWKEKYKVDDKMKEIADKDFNDKIAAARADERTKVLSENMASPGGPVSRAMDSGLDRHIMNIVKPTQGAGTSDAVKAAMASYARGDFRVEEKLPQQ